ncbi:hypothetical protein [Hyphomicrobium sp.]|uniref:hypothetical protein n=1 Tax=Hyphomicrobium sp. TaxID=82 RepID=UPI000FA85355|nr:hypothetical protein [Hyphomicrobium sp.]RUO98563.1 MAG: hypothetical protein EKK30_10060 [Hyphomicrobium sp.]
MTPLWKDYCVHFDVRQHFTLETTAKTPSAAVRKAKDLYERQAGQLFVFTLIDVQDENWEAVEVRI